MRRGHFCKRVSHNLSRYWYDTESLVLYKHVNTASLDFITHWTFSIFYFPFCDFVFNERDLHFINESLHFFDGPVLETAQCAQKSAPFITQKSIV